MILHNIESIHVLLNEQRQLAETLQQQNNNLNQEISSLRIELEQRTNQQNQLQNEQKTLLDKLQAQEQNTREIQEENELILSQLHQTQEELERFFLENKELNLKDKINQQARNALTWIIENFHQTNYVT